MTKRPTCAPAQLKALEDNRAPAWGPGQSGNPKGRAKGSRNKLAESFLTDLLEDWETNGMQAIKTMREKKPGDYVRVVASTIPRHFIVEDKDPTEDMSLDELASLADRSARRVIELSKAIDLARRADSQQPAGSIPTLQ